MHAPGDDPMGYESSAERWSPVQSVEKILLSVVSMLAGKIWTKQSYLSLNDSNNIIKINCSKKLYELSFTLSYEKMAL